MCLGCYSMTVWFGLRNQRTGVVLIFGVTALGNGQDGLVVAGGTATPVLP